MAHTKGIGMLEAKVYDIFFIFLGLTKKKELFTTTPSTDTCRGGKNQLFDLFSQPQTYLGKYFL